MFTVDCGSIVGFSSPLHDCWGRLHSIWRSWEPGRRGYIYGGRRGISKQVAKKHSLACILHHVDLECCYGSSNQCTSYPSSALADVTFLISGIWPVVKCDQLMINQISDGSEVFYDHVGGTVNNSLLIKKGPTGRIGFLFQYTLPLLIGNSGLVLFILVFCYTSGLLLFVCNNDETVKVFLLPSMTPYTSLK